MAIDAERLFPIVIVLLAVGMSAVTDALKFKIYNVITLPLIISGIAYHTVTSGVSGLSFSVTGICFALIALGLPYVLGAMGAGDVKLVSGVGAWFGVWVTAVVFLIAALVGAVYSVLLLMYRGKLGESIVGFRLAMYQVSSLGRHLGADESVEGVVESATRRQRLVPFGVMTALALVAVIVWAQFV